MKYIQTERKYTCNQPIESTSRVSSALNTKQRFDPDQLYNLMDLLSGAGSAVGDFLTVVDAVTNPGQNSPYYLVQKSIMDFALLAHNDIELLMR